MMRRHPLAATALLALLCMPSPAVGQDEVADAPQPPPCSADEHHGFDFWLGEWSVENVATGDASARNRIRAIHDGCGVLEEYTNGAYSGTSLNYYDAGTGRWHQSWVDNQGQGLRIAGGIENGAMVLRSEPSAEGAVHRVTWTPRADGSVRQHWQSTADGGATWSTVFDGIYRRLGAGGSGAPEAGAGGP